MIRFTDLHDKLIQYTTHLITKKELLSWLGENVPVRKYISISEKYAIISMFIKEFNNAVKNVIIDNEKAPFVYLTYDINCMFNLLFRYTDIIVLSKNQTVDNYDLMMQSGFYDYVISKCKNDYLDLQRKCDRTIGIDIYSVVRELQVIFATPPSVEDIEKFKESINEIDPSKLEILKTIEEYNNPMMKKVIDGITKESVKEAIKGVPDLKVVK